MEGKSEEEENVFGCLVGSLGNISNDLSRTHSEQIRSTMFDICSVVMFCNAFLTCSTSSYAAIVQPHY